MPPKRAKNAKNAILSRLAKEFDFSLRVTPVGQVISTPPLFKFGQFTLTREPSLPNDFSTFNNQDIPAFLGCFQASQYAVIFWEDDDQLEGFHSIKCQVSLPSDILFILSIKGNRIALPILAKTLAEGAASDDVITLDVLFPEKGIADIKSSTDAVSVTPNKNLKILVKNFFNIDYPDYPHEMKKLNFDDLYYDVIHAQEPMRERWAPQLAQVQHPKLRATLRPYQREGVAWMLEREREPALSPSSDPAQVLFVPIIDANGRKVFYNRYGGFFVNRVPVAVEDGDLPLHKRRSKGGVLADEMGLGKTLEVLALVINNPRNPNEMGVVPGPSTSSASSGSYYERHGFEPNDDCSGVTDEVFEETSCQCVECRKTFTAGCVENSSSRCPHCWSKRDPLPVKTTLIVSPATICEQWQDEIDWHVGDKAARLYIYKGVTSPGGYVPPDRFNDFDIVLTTYETLRKEVHHANLIAAEETGGRTRSLRHGKRYSALPSPLPSTLFWRVVLDEAQMVEACTAQAALMVLQIPAMHRWCVTGTPIHKSLQDLYGLMVFLGEEPYTQEIWFKELLLKPYQYAGERGPLVQVLSKCFRRTMKRDVGDQIGIPEQKDVIHYLKFTPVEEVFYKTQAEECAAEALKIANQFPDQNAVIANLERSEVTTLLAPLKKLRQACCHPQAVKGTILALRTNSLTVDDLLQSLIKKTTAECEDAHRRLISDINGIAGIFIIDQEYVQAAEMYRQVLWSIEEHKSNIKTDLLQQFHALFNLAELLESNKKQTSGQSDNSNSNPSAIVSPCATPVNNSSVAAIQMMQQQTQAANQQTSNSPFDNSTAQLHAAAAMAAGRSAAANNWQAAATTPLVDFRTENTIIQQNGYSIQDLSAQNPLASCSYGGGARTPHEAAAVAAAANHQFNTGAPPQCDFNVIQNWFAQVPLYPANLPDQSMNPMTAAAAMQGFQSKQMAVVAAHQQMNQHQPQPNNNQVPQQSQHHPNNAAAAASLNPQQQQALVVPQKKNARKDSATPVSAITPATTPFPATNQDTFPRNLTYIPRAPGDEKLRDEAERVKNTYLQRHLSTIEHSLEGMKEAQRKTTECLERFIHSPLNKTAPWYILLLNECVCNGESDHVVRRVKEDLEAKRLQFGTYLGNRFSDINGLQYVVQSQLDHLHDTRKLVLKLVQQLSTHPTKEEIQQAIDCHLRPSKKKRDKCKYCLLQDMFNMYESRLFCFDPSAPQEEPQDRDEALVAPTRRGCWGDSDIEKIIACLSQYARHRTTQTGVISDAALHVQYFSLLKKEFKALRSYYKNIKDYVAALDELEMAALRLEVGLDDYYYLNNQRPANVLRPWEVDEQKAKLKADRALCEAELKKKLGQLFYLQNLEKASSLPKDNPDACPVCKGILGEQWSVMQCGHNLCLICVQHLVNKHCTTAASQSAKLAAQLRIPCPLCRESSTQDEIYYVDTKAKKQCGDSSATNSDDVKPTANSSGATSGGSQTGSGTSSTGNVTTNNGNNDGSATTTTVGGSGTTNSGTEGADGNSSQLDEIEVRGSHSTKVAGVVQALLRIRRDDPQAKALVFSNWVPVLQVLNKALNENNIPCVCLTTTGHAFMKNLRMFKRNRDIMCLLLPIKLGSRGLNLTEASHILLTEPLLNMGDELQALGRIHRIGQTRDTFVHRFVIRNTIEEKIMEFMKHTSDEPSQSKSSPETEDSARMTVADFKKLFTH